MVASRSVRGTDGLAMTRATRGSPANWLTTARSAAHSSNVPSRVASWKAASA